MHSAHTYYGLKVRTIKLGTYFTFVLDQNDVISGRSEGFVYEMTQGMFPMSAAITKMNVFFACYEMVAAMIGCRFRLWRRLGGKLGSDARWRRLCRALKTFTYLEEYISIKACMAAYVIVKCLEAWKF